MKRIYTTKMINTGGREGESVAPDESLKLKISRPGAQSGGTNPEQLFAAGYAACFNSALELVLMQAKVKAKTTVSAEVAIYDNSLQDYYIGVDIEGHIDGMDVKEAADYMEKAHAVCPYSKAISGNVEVRLKAV